jgi:hypothetical protein
LIRRSIVKPRTKTKRFVSGHGFSAVPFGDANMKPRAGTAQLPEKLDTFVAVVPHGRVSQYWNGYGRAEATALIRSGATGGQV